MLIVNNKLAPIHQKIVQHKVMSKIDVAESESQLANHSNNQKLLKAALHKRIKEYIAPHTNCQKQ